MGAAAGAELVKIVAHTREAQEKLGKARLPVEDTKPDVLRKALAVVERDYEAKRAEAERNHEAKRGEVEAARIELAALELEMKQAVLRAPVGGVVTSAEVKVGDLLEPGKAVVEVAEQVGFFF